MRGMILAAVGVGGAIGSMARYLLAGFVQSPAWNGFPYGIFIVNVTGGFVMGLLVEGMALKFNVSPVTRAFLTTGIMGGYTTFSTFSLEAVMLIQKKDYQMALGYVLGSVVLSVVGVMLGLYLTRKALG